MESKAVFFFVAQMGSEKKDKKQQEHHFINGNCGKDTTQKYCL